MFETHQNQGQLPIHENLRSDIQPSQLISFISLSHYELHKLINDSQSFIRKVSKLNNDAKSKIQVKLYKQALLQLNQAQKILQYAAGSGKNIDRDLIVCVLHNLSCVYQRLWILPKCTTYIEGLIFNLDNHITSLQSSISSAQINQNSYQKTSTYEVRQSLSIYHLKFLALNSQLKQHRVALNSGKRSVSILRDILLQNQVYFKRSLKQQFEIFMETKTKQDVKIFDKQISTKYQVLQQILMFGQNIDISKYKNLIKAAHFALQIFNKQQLNSSQTPIAHYFKNHSIGNVMEIQALTFPQKNNKNQKLSKEPETTFIYKFILLSIGYFSIGTQIRLMYNDQHSKNDSLQKQSDRNFRQSDIYHLLAIMILMIFVPFQVLYMKHLLNSYKTHYNSDFFDYKTVETQSLSKIIFLISGKRDEKQQIREQNEYHLKQRLFDKMKTQKYIPTIRKSKNSRSKNNKTSLKTISFLQNKSTVIDKQYPFISKHKIQTANTKQKQKQTSKTKSKLKKKQKSKQILNNIKKIYVKGQSKSHSKSKKSLSKYNNELLLKKEKGGGSASSSNKQTNFFSKQIGLSSIVQNNKSKLEQKQKEKKIQSQNNINLRKIKSGTLKQIQSIKRSKSNHKN